MFLWKNEKENLHQKLVPDAFLILVNDQKSYCIQDIILKIWYF